MEYSVKSSTVEAFANQAGIQTKSGTLFTLNNRFEFNTKNTQYVAQFLEGETSVAKFYQKVKDGTVKFLTREEASDLLEIISSRLNFFGDASALHKGALTHLQQNLPNLGFSKETPYMQERKPSQNAKNWAWELNNE